MAGTRAPDRVLVTDDDRMSREVLALLLEAEGYQVNCAASGESAIARLREPGAGFSVVLSDVHMPGLAGVELAAALRLLCDRDVVLLAMSGSEVPEPTAAAFDGFLLKPFHARELARTIERCRASKLPGSKLPGRSPDGIGGAVSGTLSAPVAASKLPMDLGRDWIGSGAETTAISSQGAPLDERIYGQLGDTMPPQQLRQMYGLCLEDVRHRIAEMRHLVAAHQGENFAREAHAIKGGCGMLGATELYRMAAELERAGLEAAGLQGAPDVNPLDELAAACDRLERMLATRT